MDDMVYIVGAAGGSTDSSGGAGISLSADYKSPEHFSAVYESASTIRLTFTNFPFTPRATDFAYIKILRSTGVIEFVINGVDDSFTLNGSLLGVSSVALDSNDIYEVGMNARTTIVSELVRLQNGAISMPANYFSPADFAVTYASPSTLNCVGAPFTVDDSTCFVLSVMVKSAANVWKKYINGVNGVSIYALNDLITIAGHTDTAFASGDLAYRVAINYQSKNYDPSTDTSKVSVMNPTAMNYVQDSLVDDVNFTADTRYYPSSDGLSMDGYKNFSITGKFIEQDGTITMTVETTNGAGDASPDWVQIYGYDTKNNSIINSFAVTNTAAGGTTFAWDFDNLNHSAVRVKLVNTIDDSASNTVIVKARRTY